MADWYLASPGHNPTHGTAHVSLIYASSIQVPVDPVTMKADVKATANAMSTNTIMVYASAPSFPHGVIDPVEKLARLATRYGVRDCCSHNTHKWVFSCRCCCLCCCFAVAVVVASICPHT